MSRLEVYLFGSPQISVDGRLVQPGSHKALAVVAYLAVRGEQVRRETLATLFWPDQDPTRGRAYLRQTLWTINRTSGEERFEAGTETVALRSGYSLDVQTFLDKIAECNIHGHAPEESCPRCIAPLEEAAALYRGDFMTGLTLRDSPEFDDWQTFQTEHLRLTYAGVLDRLAHQFSADEAWEKALGYARRRLALDPLHEPAHRRLMQIYALSRQRSAAINQYDTLRQLLEDELGAEPEAETEALYQAIRSGKYARPSEAKPGPEPAPAIQLPTPGFLDDTDQGEEPGPLFVGRENELDQIDRHLQAALAGNGRMVFIAGEAGSGKSSLLAEFARRSEQAHPDLLTARGDCNAFFGTGDAYLPFRELLSTLSGDVESRWVAGEITRKQARRIWQVLPHTLEIIQREGPDLIDVFVPGSVFAKIPEIQKSALASRNYEQAVARSRGMGSELAQIQIFDQLTRVFQSLAARRPLLILLDDLQWADNASISLLFHLARKLAGSPILILGAYRPSEVALGRAGRGAGEPNPHPLEPVVNELKRYYGEILVELGTSEAEEGRAFIDALLDSEPNRLSPEFREALCRRTKGQPLFTVELLRDLQERGALIRNEGGEWVEGKELNWESLPARVEAVIEQRFSRLEPALLELLSIASIEGEEFSAQVAARVQGVDERQVLNQLARKLAKQHRLVYERGEIQAGAHRLTRYQFGHVLFQQYLYHRLSLGERRLLHGEVARTLEALYNGQTEEITTQLAHHYYQAGEAELAAIYLNRAGDQARERLALIEALGFFRAALEVWPAADPAGRADALYKQGECLWVTGQTQQARESFEQALHLYETLGSLECAGAMERLIGRMYWEANQREPSLQHYHRALAILESLPESVELARAVSAISQMHMLASEFDEAIAWGERALEMAERLGVEDVSLHALTNLGTAYLFMGELDRGQSMVRESLDRALALGLPHDALRAYANLGEGLNALCRSAEAHQVFLENIAYAQTVHAEIFYLGASIRTAEIEWTLGRWQEGVERVRTYLPSLLGEEADLPGPWKVWACAIIGMLLNDLGRFAAARQILERKVTEARISDELQGTAPHLGVLFRTYAALGRGTENQEILKEFLRWLDRSPYFDHNSQMPLLYACLWAGRQAEGGGQEDIHACLRVLEKADRQLRTPETAACLAEGRGNWKLAQGDFAGARQDLQAALGEWEKLERPYDQIRALKATGEALARSGEGQSAQKAYAQALRLAGELREQLKEADLQSAFWNSPLIQEILNAQ